MKLGAEKTIRRLQPAERSCAEGSRTPSRTAGFRNCALEYAPDEFLGRRELLAFVESLHWYVNVDNHLDSEKRAADCLVTDCELLNYLEIKLYGN